MIGFVTRPHGVHGAVKVHPTGPTISTLVAGETVRIGASPYEVLELSGTHDRPVMRIRGVEDRDAAATLRGGEIRVAGERLPQPTPGEFYVRDLIGCRVFVDADSVGVVVDVQSGPANDALIFEQDGRRYLVAFVVETVVRLDLEAGEVHVLPEQSVELPVKGASGAD